MTGTLRLIVVLALCLGASANLRAADQPGKQSTKVYRCETQGKVTYSDTACEKAEDKVEVDTGGLNIADAQDTSINSRAIDNHTHNSHSSRSSGSSSRSSSRQASSSVAANQAQHKERCKQIASASDTIRGYETHMDTVRNFTDTADSQVKDLRKNLEKQRKDSNCR